MDSDPGPDPIPEDLHQPLMDVSVGLLRWTRTNVNTFWVADGQDGFKSTYGVIAMETPNGRYMLRLRHLGEGTLAYETTLN